MFLTTRSSDLRVKSKGKVKEKAVTPPLTSFVPLQPARPLVYIQHVLVYSKEGAHF